MRLAIVYSRAQIGLTAPLVTVEAHLSPGLPSFSIVGLPETAVKESKDRVRSAILNSQFEFPASRIIVNLAPADLPKEGCRFDLPIALGILAASSQIASDQLDKYEFAGELALSGDLRKIQHALPLALGVQNSSRTLILPEESAKQAAQAKQCKLLAPNNLLSVCQHLSGEKLLPGYEPKHENIVPEYSIDLLEVEGQLQAKRVLEIAAAGKHSLLMVGPPGTGKTLLASRLPTVLPLLKEQQALEVAAIYALCPQQDKIPPWQHRPFRAPHHTASAIALVGGGSKPKPGEISLAHQGVLFLDELPEFDKKVLEVLRGPLESGKILISRAGYQAEFPASFQLIAAMNPCPCGYQTHPTRQCHCSIEQIRRYQSRLSGPLLDRIDLHIEVPMLLPPQLEQLKNQAKEKSITVKNRVIKTRSIQMDRQKKLNNQLNTLDIKNYCPLPQAGHNLLTKATEKMGLSMRAYHRIIRVARTIADLNNQTDISVNHLGEALSYRPLF